MADIIRNRTIRPSSRKESSKSYKIDTEVISKRDILIVNIDHVSSSFRATYRFKGEDVANRNSIHFRVNDYGSHIDISWSGAEPISLTRIPDNVKEIYPTEAQNEVVLPFHHVDDRIGFDPVVDNNSRILVLGTFPGNESLRKHEYYANPRNLFWPMMFFQTNSKPVLAYDEKILTIQKHGIAIWDVCKACLRDGSLDSKISEETPNNISAFLAKYPGIKAIAFNGQKAAELFQKHFGILEGITLFNLPSTSPANTGISLAEKQKEWRKILI